ncbi:MAG: hypothetical protein HQL23_04620 [Candidatus Omnitrophica bacterium]|nr:hypothetical protein [Candidatus Omnitrophota bacterium]
MNRKLAIFISLILIALFGFKDVLILAFSQWPHLTPVVGTPTLTFEEVYGYLPFVNAFAFLHPLPAAPMADPQLSALTFFPPLTTLITGMIYQFVCGANPDAYLLVMHVVFPLASFWLLYLFFLRYVSVSWAVLLAFFGLTFYNNFSSLGYYAQLGRDSGAWLSLASLTPLEITRSPSPSFTFFVFMLCFYITTANYKLSLRRSLFFTALWALNIYIYLFNFLAGILFWFLYLVLAQVIREKRWATRKLFLGLALNGVLVLMLVLPYLLKFSAASNLDWGMIRNMGIDNRNDGLIVNDWGIALSYVLPIFLCGLLIRFYCQDYYELFYRFGPVFVMIGVEIIILNLHMILGKFFQTQLFSLRIGNFFTRYLYYLPFIYFFTAPVKLLYHNPRKNAVLRVFYDLINRWIIQQRHIIAAAGMAAIGVIILASGIKYYQFHECATARRMELLEQRVLTAVSRFTPRRGVIVFEDLAANLYLPVRTSFSTLLVSSFSNHVPREEIIDRLLLYAKIFSWDQKRLLDFMLPAPWLKVMYERNDFVFSDSTLEKGFGYWLVWHRNKLSDVKLREYAAFLSERYLKIDTAALKQKFQVVDVVYDQGSPAAECKR